MTNCLFYSIIFVLFLNFTVGSIKYSQVNRTFMSLYKGVFEAATYTIDENGNPIEPYYKKSLISTYINQYLKENLNRYVTDYSVSYKYYLNETSEVCKTNYCRSVKVTLKAKINMFYTYNQTQNFSIHEREAL